MEIIAQEYALLSSEMAAALWFSSYGDGLNHYKEFGSSTEVHAKYPMLLKGHDQTHFIKRDVGMLSLVTTPEEKAPQWLFEPARTKGEVEAIIEILNKQEAELKARRNH